MDVDAFLCDHAEVAEGKLFANGAGINICLVSMQPPHVVNLFLAAVVHVPYTATNQAHQLTVSIVDEDGQGMVPWVPEGAGSPGPVVLETEFTVGRPPTLQPGESQPVPVAFGFQGMPVPALGSYSFQRRDRWRRGSSAHLQGRAAAAAGRRIRTRRTSPDSEFRSAVTFQRRLLQRIVVCLRCEFDGHFLLGASSFRLGAFPQRSPVGVGERWLGDRARP